jgi:hypothetical protein
MPNYRANKQKILVSIYPIYGICRRILVLFIYEYVTRLASNENSPYQ